MRLAVNRKRIDRIKAEMKKAEEYLHAADILHSRGLFNPSVSSSHNSAFHAASAAFLTAGIHGGENFSNFIEVFARFNHKLGPVLRKLKDNVDGFHIRPMIEYDENEALLRIHQTKEFLMEVKDFLRKALR